MTTVSADEATRIANEFLEQRETDLDFNSRTYRKTTLNIDGKFELDFGTMKLTNNKGKCIDMIDENRPINFFIRPDLYTIHYIIRAFVEPYYGYGHNVQFNMIDSKYYLTFELDFPFSEVYSAIFNFIYNRTKIEEFKSNYFHTNNRYNGMYA